VVHRRAANSAAGKYGNHSLEIAHDRIVSMRDDSLRLRAGRNQKIVHLRIVLGAGFA
jgi:hypothetical protein